MIIEARHHPIIDPFFTWYARRAVKKHFHTTTFIRDFEDRKLPVLMIANHMSWWDGMWLRVMNTQYLKRKFNFMMLEEQLKKHWYFQHTGGFSIKKGTRSIVESLRHASALLSDPSNLVIMFPQGEIQSMHTREFVFEKGIGSILSGADAEVQLLMTANIIDYFSRKKPGLFSYITEYKGEIDHLKIQEAYREFYMDCISRQLKIKDI